MQKIYISDAGPKVSSAIYGFYRWHADVNDPSHTMEHIINLCLDKGINTFDHADTYGGYQCEELFGKALEKKTFKREDVVLFTKAGLVVPHPGQPGIRVKHYNTSRDHIVKSVDNSLKRLQTDYIDIFLLNHLDPLSDIEETALALQRLKERGKIKNIGVVGFSVFQHQLLASALRIPIVTNHIELNLLNTAALDNGQVDFIKQKFMRPLATAPLAAGRIENGTDTQAVKVRMKLEELGKKYNADIESIAVAWVVKLGALPIIGTTSEKRIQNIVKAFSIDLDNQDWYDLYTTSTGIMIES
jgi:predicted oxidoreductase